MTLICSQLAKIGGTFLVTIVTSATIVTFSLHHGIRSPPIITVTSTSSPKT
jgi:hypothetical protein